MNKEQNQKELEDDIEEDKEAETLVTDTPKEQRGEKQALDKVNVFTEEKELDTTKAQQPDTVQNLKSLLETTDKRDREAKAQRERELAAVVISEENIQLLMKELELPRKKAETILRQAKGDAVASIRQFIAAK